MGQDQARRQPGEGQWQRPFRLTAVEAFSSRSTISGYPSPTPTSCFVASCNFFHTKLFHLLTSCHLMSFHCTVTSGHPSFSYFTPRPPDSFH